MNLKIQTLLKQHKATLDEIRALEAVVRERREFLKRIEGAMWMEQEREKWETARPN